MAFDRTLKERRYIIIPHTDAVDLYSTHAALMLDAQYRASEQSNRARAVVVAEAVGTVDENGRFTAYPDRPQWAGHTDPEFVALSEMLARYQADLTKERDLRKAAEKKVAEVTHRLRALVDFVEDAIPF